MILREYKDRDLSPLLSILLDIGLKEDEIMVDRFRTYILEDDTGKLIGFMTMTFESLSIAHLVHEYVKPEYRGKGYGQILGELFKRVAERNGRTILITNIDSRDKDTYEKVNWFFNGSRKIKDFIKDSKVIEFYQLGEV